MEDRMAWSGVNSLGRKGEEAARKAPVPTPKATPSLTTLLATKRASGLRRTT